MSDFYALLIGIDYYQFYPPYIDLSGAVRDIDMVADYLNKSLHIPSERINKLTAPLPDTNSFADVRAARQEMPPTYQNIVNAFNSVTETAQSGDQVYIHYSGHGGRAVTIYPELEGDRRQDEGIVPVDISSSDGRYLRDVEIATLLKRLTDKGCIVTVIFDSCHSGGATRGDCAIRGSENNLIDTTARNQNSLVASREELLNNWRILTQADPDLSGGWLPNKDYVFLAACRPSEFAHECAENGGQSNGALTYWMMDTLTSSNSVLTYKSLYNRVRGKVQSKFADQSPMLSGDGDRLVFGDKRKCKPYTVVIVKIDPEKPEITLDAGLAQGLSTGTRFAIYPFDIDDLEDQTQQIAIVELTDDIKADKSIAKILDAAAGGIEVKGTIEPGALAVMVAAPTDLIRKVRLFDRKEVGEREQDLPADLVNKQTTALERVRQALTGNGWVVEVKDGEEGHYQVAVGRDGAYEICIGMPIKNLRPALSIEDPQAPQKVVARLVHLTKYQAVQELDNPASKLTEYLVFEICDENKQPFPDPQNVSLKFGEEVYLKIENTSSTILNVTVLDLEPTWEISQFDIRGERSSFVALEPGEKAFSWLAIQEIPEDYQQAKETLKIFAMKGLANFQWLILPSLDEPLPIRGNSPDQELKTRAFNQHINPLNNLLSAIGSDLDNPPEKTRKAVSKSSPKDEWTTQEIQITITQ
jgi:hypothetical protein